MSRPLIQIDDEIREMTDEEYSQHQKDIAEYVPIVIPESEQ
jgi:hypothetical protein